MQKYFEKFFISSETGSLKHEGKMFELAQNYLSIPKEQILMIDDSLDHGVYPAKEFGWNAIWISRNNDKRQKEEQRIQHLTELYPYLFPSADGNM